MSVKIYDNIVLFGKDVYVWNKEKQKSEKSDLLEVLNGLPNKERQIMCMRYGIGGKEEMTQKDVAEVLGISQSYISRIEKKVIRKIKGLVKC